MKLDFANQGNVEYIEEVYERYRRDPGSVGQDWVRFFAGFELGADPGARLPRPAPGRPTAAAGATPALGVFDLIHSYRELGHLVADLDPLGHNRDTHPLLELSEFGIHEADLDRVVECPSFYGCDTASVRQLLDTLRDTYCRTIGVEYMFISSKEQRIWLQERMEPSRNRPSLNPEERRHLLNRLIHTEDFERFLNTKYVGQKRFSIEGAESLIPLLACLIDTAGGLGCEEVVMGMAHRGRLNVLANILGKPYEMIFSEFEGTFLPKDIQGDGDVKYHLGFSRDHMTRDGRKMHLSLLSNPSHLEAVMPIVEGIVRAKQQHRRDIHGDKVMPLHIHGDAAFTGQGVVAETLALSDLCPYTTGGSVHVIINNQIGFTTSPWDYRFTTYPSDVAKVIDAPVFHVNGDDPEATVQAAQLAVAYRHEFKKDVIIDLVCFRRHGHNEADDPTFTQPVMYREIREHPGVRQKYTERLLQERVVQESEVKRAEKDFRETLENALTYARDFMPRQQVFALGGLWEGMGWAGEDWSADTRVSEETLRKIVDHARDLPESFHAHPRVEKLLEERARMLGGEGRIDWGCAEMLAFGSVLLEGTKIRLAGEDSGRGTFSQRHAVLYDRESGKRYVPLDHLSDDQGRFVVIDTMLSENAVLGFEYGFSQADPRNLVLWEAQFGDFINGAQVVVDQFLSSAESKWQRMSGLVLLLPHGYEGQGPEHSSARLERFLQLCAENNMQVCYPTTPAQYFHVLRRQMHRRFRKPLVLMTPKSLLRHRLVISPVRDFTDDSFRLTFDEVDELDRHKVGRVVLCSGKVYYDLLLERREREAGGVALVRVEQLYPFPAEELKQILEQYPAAGEVAWVQEEPRNMGAWTFMLERLPNVLGKGRSLEYVGRDEAASPATGSYKVHHHEQSDLIERALRPVKSRPVLRKAHG